MIRVLDRGGSPEVAVCGLDIQRLMWGRPEQYAMLCADNDGLSLLFAQDAAEAAMMVMNVMRSGCCGADDVLVPQQSAPCWPPMPSAATNHDRSS